MAPLRTASEKKLKAVRGRFGGGARSASATAVLPLPAKKPGGGQKRAPAEVSGGEKERLVGCTVLIGPTAEAVTDAAHTGVAAALSFPDPVECLSKPGKKSGGA